MRMSQDEHLKSTNNVILTDQSKSNLSKNYNKNGKDVKSQNEIFDSRLSKLSAAYGKPMYLKTQFNFAMNEHLAQKKSVIIANCPPGCTLPERHIDKEENHD